MLALAIIGLVTEGLKAFNLVYADEPLAQRRAGAMTFWNASKVLIFPLLTDEQRKQLSALETTIGI